MQKPTPVFVGLDVHKETISVAYAAGGTTAAPHFVGQIGIRRCDVDKLVRRLQGQSPRLVFGAVGLECCRCASLAQVARGAFGQALRRFRSVLVITSADHPCSDVLAASKTPLNGAWSIWCRDMRAYRSMPAGSTTNEAGRAMWMPS